MKYAVCNEMFGSLSIEKTAEILQKTGYQGIEFAPYTLFGTFTSAEIAAGIQRARAALDANGLAYAGFHWLMVGPQPFNLTSPDPAIRIPSIEHLRKLLHASGELGGGMLILGSPKQRCTQPGQTVAEATKILEASLAALADESISCNSKILVEALSSDQTNVVNTLEEARRMIQSINSDGISGMFDFHNVGDETDPWETLIYDHKAFIKHVHINEMDGNAPGTGKSDYRPAFNQLKRIGYDGWISMEIFSQPTNPEQVAALAMKFMRSIASESSS